MINLEQEIVRRMAIKLRDWAYGELYGPVHGPGLLDEVEMPTAYSEARKRLEDG